MPIFINLFLIFVLIKLWVFYRTTLCVSAVFAVARCPSVPLSRWCIVVRQLKISLTSLSAR